MRRAISDIAADPALVITGALIASTHVLSAAVWLTIQPLSDVIARERPAVCWPFAPDCEALHALDAAAVQAGVWGFGFASLLCAVLFLLRRVSAATVSLAALTVIKIAVVALDFRLRLNQHLMVAFFSIVFLVWPNKRAALRLIVVLFYVAAGLLKLNAEWLSGSALYDVENLPVPAALIPAACAAVVVLELGLVWGLFAKSARVHRIVLALLIVFHLASWPIVGFFYPLVMIALLAIHPVCRAFPRESVGDRAPRTSTWVLAAVFMATQALPAAIPGDSATTGEGRWLALHMFDAKVQCKYRVLAVWGDGRTEKQPLPDGLSWRIHCDPIVFWNMARQACRRDPRPARVEVALVSHRTSEAREHTVLSIADFCALDPSYALWRHNAWIDLDSP